MNPIAIVSRPHRGALFVLGLLACFGALRLLAIEVAESPCVVSDDAMYEVSRVELLR